jgi:methylated-DNA-protein-cysteine methyltransferase-like protein
MFESDIRTMKRPGKTQPRKTSATKPAGRKALRKKVASEITAAGQRDRVVHLIRSLPKGKVSTYGAVARAAGWPGAARQVVRVLRQVNGLPWHRVLGAGGAIKLPGESGAEQRFRLRMEGVTFRGMRVDMKQHEFQFKTLRH